MTDPNAINAIVRTALDPAFETGPYPTRLGVICDGVVPIAGTKDSLDDCGLKYEADFIVSTEMDRDQRLGIVLDAAAVAGWLVVRRHQPGMAFTYCPDHHAQVRPLTIPADQELVGTQFPGQMPQATWDELMAWYEANGVNPDRIPLTRDVVLGSTIDRWEAVGVDGNGEPIKFGEGPARSSGVMLREGEEWSHAHPGYEHTARPVRFVSTPVTTPLPQHLRTAIEKAAAGKDLPGAIRTAVEWSAQYAVRVTDPDGWREEGAYWHQPISQAEFERRAAISTVEEVPLTGEQEAADVLRGLLTLTRKSDQQ